MYSRAQLFIDVCDFLKEGRVTPTSPAPLAVKIRGKETKCAERILSRHPWNFAEECDRLQLDTQANADPTVIDASLQGYKYAWKMPAGVARKKWVSTTPREVDKLLRAGEWTHSGARILSNYSPLYLCSVKEKFAGEGLMGHWPTPFGQAVASDIADELAAKVTNSRNHAADVSARTQAFIEEAELWDANQSPPPSRREGRWLRSRFGRARMPGDRL